jgi:hypothetical protein
MEQKSIASAILAFTKYVRENMGAPSLDATPAAYPPSHSPAELAAWRSDVESVCADMDALARTTDPRLADFERLRQKMENFPSTPPEYHQAVRDAFFYAGHSDAKWDGSSILADD